MPKNIYAGAMHEGHIITHPVRFRLLQYLRNHPEAHISQIVDGVGLDRRLVSFHLLTLERNGFVVGHYEISKYPNSLGRAIKKYQATPKVNKAFSELEKVIPKGSSTRSS